MVAEFTLCESVLEIAGIIYEITYTGLHRCILNDSLRTNAIKRF